LKLLSIILILLFPFSWSEGQHADKNILILNSYHKGFQWTDNIVRGVEATFKDEGIDSHIQVEYMDSKVVKYDRAYQEMLCELYRYKYGDKEFDVIITTDDNALDFVISHQEHEEVLQGVPVVFAGVNDLNAEAKVDRKRVTGVLEISGFRGTLNLILDLHPNTNKIVLIADRTPSGSYQYNQLEPLLTDYINRGVSFSRWDDTLTMEQIEERMRGLWENTVAVFMTLYRDSTGRYVSLEEGVTRISQESKRPLYTFHAQVLEYGTIGGKLLSGFHHGKKAAEMAVLILDGEKPEDIPIVDTTTAKYMFDYRQLKRYGIDFDELPEDSIIGDIPRNMYREHKWEIAGVIAVGAVLVTAIALLYFNIGRRKRISEKLDRSEEKYGEVVGLSPDAIVVLQEGGYKMVSPAFTKLFGYTQEEAVGGLMFGDLVNEADKAKVQKRYDDRINGVEDMTKDFQVDLIAKDGSVIPCETSAAMIQYEGEPADLVLIRDITERKQAEQEKLTLERQMLHAQKLESLGVLAGGIAHDFNNILMAILGNADLALKLLAPLAPSRSNIEEVINASVRAADLAKQMLAYSGKGRFIVEPIHLGELIKETSHLLEVSISKKATLRRNFEKNTPTFDGDVTQIRQVIMNLITNASESLLEESGVITLTTGSMYCDAEYLECVNEVLKASLEEPLKPGDYVFVEVADTGCGMSQDTKEKIFDPFFTTKFTGRGLGMSAVLGIVRGHQGAIKIYSEVDRGTTFKIYFPANVMPDREMIRHEEEEGVDDWKGSGLILIADDEKAVAMVGKRMIELLGFEGITAYDGKEAVKVFKENMDDIVCVLLDLTMPRMDGLEVFQEIRSLRPNTPIVLCSGYNEQDATQKFVGRGLAGFLQKPYTMDKLQARLKGLLG